MPSQRINSFLEKSLSQSKVVDCLFLGKRILYLFELFFDQMEPQLYAESYKLLCLAGDGGQGQVFLAEKDSHNYIIKTYFPNPKVQSYYLAQTQILSCLDSPNIIRLIQCFDSAKVDAGKGEIRQPVIVLEFAERGDLFKIVNRGKICQEACRTMFKQMIRALRNLKEAEIAHLDLKLENIFLDQNFNIKLGDFGYAQKTNSLAYLTTWQGTKGYIAPQIHDRQYKGDKVDLFAIGVALFLMVVRIPPFFDTTRAHSQYTTIRNGDFDEFWRRFDPSNSKVTLPFKRLINALLNADPERRPSLSELQNDEWVIGKSLPQEEVKAYLEPRYKKLEEKDKQTMNIRRILRQKQKKALEEAEKQEQHRQRSRQGTFRISDQPENFIEELLSLPLELSQLPAKKYYGLSYSKATPRQVLLWLVEYLNEVKQQRKSFIDSAQSLQFNEFTLRVRNQNLVQLTFDIGVRNAKDFWTIELGLEGEIVQWNNEVSICWKKKAGNDFWLSQIKENIEDQFITFFQIK